MNSDFAELIGAIIGDGHIYHTGRHYGFGITGDPVRDKKYFNNRLVPLITVMFQKKPFLIKRQGGLRIILNSKAAFKELTNDIGLTYGKGKCSRVTIPPSIIDKTHLKACVRGIMDTDGSLFFSKKPGIERYPAIEISTISKNLADQLFQLLKSWDFRPTLRKQSSKMTKAQERHIIGLYGTKMIKKWNKEIGFSNPRHKNKLANQKDI